MTSRPSGFDVRSAQQVRPLHAGDRPQIEALLRASHNFTPTEVATALEVIDDALRGDPDYIVSVLPDASGFECHGPVPLTDGTFDLYWIVVDPKAQKRGFGRLLLKAAEEDVVARGGRLLLIETSSQESYAATIHFYKRNGYHLEATVHNFYRPGDDKLIFAKTLALQRV